jgi:hypothetical protein
MMTVNDSKEEDADYSIRNQTHWKQNMLHSSTAKRADINATTFQNYLKTYHKRNSESDFPLMAVVIKATTKWSKSKPP